MNSEYAIKWLVNFIKDLPYFESQSSLLGKLANQIISTLCCLSKGAFLTLASILNILDFFLSSTPQQNRTPKLQTFIHTLFEQTRKKYQLPSVQEHKKKTKTFTRTLHICTSVLLRCSHNHFSFLLFFSLLSTGHSQVKCTVYSPVLLRGVMGGVTTKLKRQVFHSLITTKIKKGEKNNKIRSLLASPNRDPFKS